MRFENREQYTEEILLCMGVEPEEADSKVLELLRVESLPRLDVILQIAEAAAINCVSAIESPEAAKVRAITQLARAHATSSKNSKIRDLMEEILEIVEDEQEPQIMFTPEEVQHMQAAIEAHSEELANVS